LRLVRPRFYWPVTLAAAALVGLLAYGLVAKGSDTSIDQAVLLNAWASWCAPCQSELPLLERAYRRMQRSGGTVLGVDVQDDQQSALTFMHRTGATFPSLRDRDRSYIHQLGVTGYPESFLIDRHGRVVALNRGPLTQAWLDANLPKVLGSAA
jgi:cytochrome c biogenesis protein CcmG/thiol:disulfide interchange protein DsbE